MPLNIATTKTNVLDKLVEFEIKKSKLILLKIIIDISEDQKNFIIEKLGIIMATNKYIRPINKARNIYLKFLKTNFKE